MKKIYTTFIGLVMAISAQSQTIFWLEEFSNSCPAYCTTYSGPNGAWSFANNGPANACGGATTPNKWYISCAENGNAAGSCGSGCGNNSTLHVGNDSQSPSAGVFCPNGDCGAAYDAGGYCDILGTPPSVISDILATSPTINCTGRTTITLTFNYIERGQGSNDNASVMYYDGTSWALLADMAKTPTTCGGGQGRWTAYNVALPVSADNNPNVAIAFHWVNDDDGSGSDPSFAVDSVRLTVLTSGAPPLAGFTQSTTLGCDSLCVTYTDGSTDATTWSWSFPGGTPSTSTQTNPVVCYNSPGTYDALQIVTNSFGTDTLLKPNLVTIVPTPVPDFTSTSQEICAGDCINYSDLSTGTVQTYSWNFQGGTPVNSTDPNPVNVCYDSAGAFSTTLIVTNGACTNSNTHVGYVNVSQAPVPVISVSGDTLYSTAGLTYQWYEVTTGPIAVGIFQYYVATLGGNYFVCITDVSGCSACSDTVHVDQEGVHEFDLNDSFSLYPNPATDKVYVHSLNGHAVSLVRILDETGRVVKNSSIVFSNSRATVSLSDFAKGYYTLQLLDEKKKIIFTAPVVKQ